MQDSLLLLAYMGDYLDSILMEPLRKTDTIDGCWKTTGAYCRRLHLKREFAIFLYYLIQEQKEREYNLQQSHTF